MATEMTRKAIVLAATKEFAKLHNRTVADVEEMAICRYIKLDMATLPERKRDAKRMPSASDIAKLLESGNTEAAMKALKVMENIQRERKEKAAKKASAVVTTTTETVTEEVKADVESVNASEVTAS